VPSEYVRPWQASESAHDRFHPSDTNTSAMRTNSVAPPLAIFHYAGYEKVNPVRKWRWKCSTRSRTIGASHRCGKLQRSKSAIYQLFPCSPLARARGELLGYCDRVVHLCSNRCDPLCLIRLSKLSCPPVGKFTSRASYPDDPFGLSLYGGMCLPEYALTDLVLQP
jgi:hypothetical protein